MNDSQNNTNPQLDILNNLNNNGGPYNQPSQINSYPNNNLNVMPNEYNPMQNTSNITLGETPNATYQDTLGNIEPQMETPSDTNQYINPPSNTNETYLNDLNVDGSYNRIQKEEAPSYVNDPKVIENMNQNKKNTIPVTKELKTVVIIALILLVFIFAMPILFDLINNLRFN